MVTSNKAGLGQNAGAAGSGRAQTHRGGNIGNIAGCSGLAGDGSSEGGPKKKNSNPVKFL